MRPALRSGFGLGWALALLLSASLLVQHIAAQESTPAADPLAVELDGVIEAINGSLITVSQRRVDTTGLNLSVPLQVGMRVVVRGSMLADGRLIARELLVVAAASPDVTPAAPAVTPEVREICALSVTHWRSHLDEWPSDALMLGAQTYSREELQLLLNLPVRNDISLLLAHQLIAAKLNAANGANPDVPDTAVGDADALLGAFTGRLPYGVTPANGATMTSVAATLYAMNTALCPAAPQPTPEPAPLATPEVGVSTVALEGQVQAMNADIIAVLDIPVRISPEQSLLLHVGAPVRVEAFTAADGVLTALSVQVTEAPAPISTAEVGAGGVTNAPVVAPAFTPEVRDDNSGMGMGSDDDSGDDNSGMGSDD
jgi:hypothetical protein